MTDPVIDSGLSFLTPFAAYVAAEEVHASGVISVVVAGLLLGHKSPILQTAQSRIAERMNWRSIAFLLESAVFLLIGLQARTIIGDAAGERGHAGAGRRGVRATLVAVIVLRLVWVFLARYLLVRPGPDGDRQDAAVDLHVPVGWAGMRGVVTLAAAFVIPRVDTAPRRTAADRLHRHRRHAVPAGALAAVARPPAEGARHPTRRRRARPGQPAAPGLAGRARRARRARGGGPARGERDDPRPRRRRDFAAWERVGASPDETPSEIYARLAQADDRRGAQRVLEIRGTGTVAHEVVDEVLAMLDVEESMLDYSARGARAGARERLARDPRGRLRPPAQVAPSGRAGHPGRVR